MPAHHNPKREAFCREYIVDFNATQAAIRASYSAKTANSMAAQIMADPEVQTRIRELIEERNTRTNITADRVIEELAKIGFASMRHFMSIDADGQPRIDLGLTPEDQLDALSEIQTETVLEMQGETAQHVRKTKIKHHDKLTALKLLGEHTGAFKTPERKTADALEQIVQSINQKGSTAPIAEE